MVNVVNTVSFEELETLIAAMTAALRLGTSFVLVFQLHSATFGLNFSSAQRLAQLTSSQWASGPSSGQRIFTTQCLQRRKINFFTLF